MGLTGFNKRRREAAALAAKNRKENEPCKPVSVSPQPEKAEDIEIKPKPVHSTEKKKAKVVLNENSKDN